MKCARYFRENWIVQRQSALLFNTSIEGTILFYLLENDQRPCKILEDSTA